MREVNHTKRKRWVSLYVENRIGVLARISGMMSGKSYNIDSITVGVTEDPTISRMTIGLSSDDATFEQIKKQFIFPESGNRNVVDRSDGQQIDQPPDDQNQIDGKRLINVLF